ncbi:MAG: integration host factor subunit beta [Oceanococcaceae bacterium]
MTKSELIDNLALHHAQLSLRDVELGVKIILDTITDALVADERIEIRGFGSFRLHERPPRVGRNPRTGAEVHIPAKRVPHFKPGKELRERADYPQGVR